MSEFDWLPLMGNERREMVRAAWFSAAEREGDAEEIREKLGYGSASCREDVDKTTKIGKMHT